MREANTGVIELQADEPTAKKFLDFLYLDKLDASVTESADLCCHVLKLAHQFEVGRSLQRPKSTTYPTL